ncbi:MAG: hypothetical protein DRI89_13460 [Bacteroidetes bacterium]|nr:MAG: hypothetical protein DRI89_13460 [Bacteroidota bacterium]
MKKIYILITALFTTFLLQGQTVLHYDFTNSLSEVNGNGPELVVLDNPGIYEQDTLGEVGDTRKWVYRFEENSGFQFDNTAAGNFLGEEYTIELYFVFDELDSWKRVVDWKNRKSDNGAYVYYGKLNFYNIVTSNEAPVATGEYTYYVITRDAASKELLIYTDAEVEISFTDNCCDALLDEDDVLNFFHDDLVVQNEASPGAVAMLKIYNYKLDSTTIQNNFDDLAGNLFYIGEQKKINTNIRTFPNPVRDKLAVDLSNFDGQETVKLRLINTTGLTVFEAKADDRNQVSIDLNTAQIQNGIYVLIAESDTKRATAKVLVQN